MWSHQLPRTWRRVLALATLVSSGWCHAVVFNITDANGEPAKQAAVSVYVKGATHNGAGKVFDMAQRDKQFAPTLLVIPTGAAVNFPNFDTIRHHVYSFSNTKTFEIKLYTGRPSAPVTFDKAGTATLGCNIHDGMVGYVHVVDTPYFGVTDGKGQVTIDVPPGDHRIRVWMPRMTEAQSGQEFRLNVGTAALPLRLTQ